LSTTLSFSKHSILADRRELLRLAICSTIELLQLEPQKLLCLHYNRSTIHPENDEEQALGDDNPVVLEFHHLDPKKKKYSISTMINHCMRLRDIQVELIKRTKHTR
jgi:hypothetical protein